MIPGPFLPDPLEILGRNSAPETISGWQAVADGASRRIALRRP